MPEKVSVLLPVYNEARHLSRSLESLAAQDYPAESLEILIADGDSSDGTLDIVERFCRQHAELDTTILSNPSRNTATGRNICLAQANGQYVLNYSGHAVAEPDLVTVLVSTLRAQQDDVAGVGCSVRAPQAGNWVERAITTILFSLLGGVNTVDSNQSGSKQAFVRSIAFTLYKKGIMDALGGFDTQFWCGQDADFNQRLHREGFKLLYVPDTAVYHYKRSALSGFVRQMYRYGVARAKLIRKYPDSWQLVFLLPSVFLLAILLALPVMAFFPTYSPLVMTLAAIFIVASFISAALARGDVITVLASPFFYTLLYGAYGFGFLRGLV